MTAEEVRRFQEMAAGSENRRSLDRLLRDAYSRISRMPSGVSGSAGQEIDEIFQEVMMKVRHKEAERPPVQPGRIIALFRRYKIAEVAAALFFIVGIGIFSYHKHMVAAASGNMPIRARIGERKSLMLPDGSSVVLNAGSTLTMADGFNTNSRKISLSGEAYFEVAKNVDLPFVIHTSSMDIKVLGTSFNVRAYPDEARDITSLITGKIEVTVSNGDGKSKAKEYYLQPLQKIVISKNGSGIALSNGNTAGSQGKPSLRIDSLRVSQLVDQIPETAWTENKLFFDAESLDQVMEKIERWYGVRVQLDNKAIENLHFTGSYQNESLDEVMQALTLSNPEVHYRIEKKNKLLILY